MSSFQITYGGYFWSPSLSLNMAMTARLWQSLQEGLLSLEILLLVFKETTPPIYLHWYPQNFKNKQFTLESIIQRILYRYRHSIDSLLIFILTYVSWFTFFSSKLLHLIYGLELWWLKSPFYILVWFQNFTLMSILNMHIHANSAHLFPVILLLFGRFL